MNPLTIKILAGAGALVLAFGAGWGVNGWRLSAAIENGRAARAETTISAIGVRVDENKRDEATHIAINQKIEATKNEELTPVVRRIADAPRVRVGPAICPVVTGATDAQSASGSDGPASGARVVSESADRDIKALMVKVEEAMATGRACQAFVRQNGLVP